MPTDPVKKVVLLLLLIGLLGVAFVALTSCITQTVIIDSEVDDCVDSAEPAIIISVECRGRQEKNVPDE